MTYVVGFTLGVLATGLALVVLWRVVVAPVWRVFVGRRSWWFLMRGASIAETRRQWRTMGNTFLR